ncbi:unnamed protein product [Chrysodeixis includens]|uniref:Ion transport domain-containing protein n=1 Tax=Chrysodeixis includens TaxID=689277 RepID=A0A9P0FW23_CHRIL|nr:unnamed protein product [Chrysodeixis includens]
MKKNSKEEPDKKPSSWYSVLDDAKEQRREFKEPGVENQNKSKSLEARSVISNNIRINSMNNTMEWLEGTLLRRRSETRVYKYNTRLLEAITDGDTAYMNRMLAMGANVNATCRLNQVSACHIAATINNDALSLLINAGAISMRSDKFGRTPLHLAAWAGHVRHIASLLDFPEALQDKVTSKMTPEVLQEIRTSRLTVPEMINRPCELNTLSTVPDAWSDGMEHNCRSIKESLPLFQPGWTALHAASARAQYKCVQLLLAAGADPMKTDLLSRTPIDVVGYDHYSKHKIDPADFRETVRMLREAGGKFQNSTASKVNTPLHTAVDLDSVDAVEEVLDAGATATLWNSHGLTAMHDCVKNRNKDILQLIANYEFGNEDPQVAVVDERDRWGYTVLSAAIKAGWTQGVCVALGAGASVTMKNNKGESPLHLAASYGNLDILQEVLIVSKFNSSLDFLNDQGETALFVAIRHNQIDVVRMLLSAGARIQEETVDRVNVLHVAAEHGHYEILEHLLEYDDHITNEMINEPDVISYTPLVHAVVNDHPKCVELLISKGANVHVEVHISETNTTTPLHLAARKNHFEICETIINNDLDTIHAVNSSGLMPLHEACYHGSRNVITLLLHRGADLSGHTGKTKLLPIDVLMNNLSKPTQFIEEIFDTCISSQGRNIQESNCKVKVDYRVLVPDESDWKQMRVIKGLVNTGNRHDQSRLLLHPLVQSFLYLKWKSLLPFFYTILAMHTCFVLALNVYVVSVFFYKDKKREVPGYFLPSIWEYILYVTIFLIAIQEIIFIKIKKRRYLLFLETWLKIWAVTLALVLPQTVNWKINNGEDWARLIATISLLLSWFEMMFLLSRFPDWGFYVLMFGKVANKVFKILLSFGFLLFGFAICFMIQFRAKVPFEGPWASFVKTMAMMTSEYDYQTTINKTDAAKVSASIIILRIIFLTFLILVSIVLMNLIAGVAVNNVNHLEMIGTIKRLEKQVEFITSLEDIVCHKLMKKVLPKKLYQKLSMNQKLKNVIYLMPRESTCSYCKYLPPRIREAIFETAQRQQMEMDEELGSMAFKMKLDQIHNIIVGSEEDESRRADLSESAVAKINEEIDKIRSEVSFIRNFLVTNRRRTISSNKSSFL